jgi:hypothetical protein
MLRRSVPRSAGRAMLAWPVVVIVKGGISRIDRRW